ncbi:MAG TPA: transglutaminase-like domain-containing protein [Chthoniobacterales bacterium]
MFPQREALIRLLRDDDPQTVNLVKEQLASNGPEALSQLQDLLRTDDERVTAHVSDVIRGIVLQQSMDTFQAFCKRFPKDGDVELGCWLLAKALIPGFDPEPFKLKLDTWGRQLAMNISHAVSDRERVQQLAQFMSGQLGFRGNVDDYYNPRNSLIPTVIETRFGIPISLTALYMFVSARAGMAVEGVNMPGHFIGRHGDVIFDPFHRGKILSVDDCEEILGRQGIQLEAQHVTPATSKGILTRMLANLLYVYESRQETALRERVLIWLAALERPAR